MASKVDRLRARRAWSALALCAAGLTAQAHEQAPASVAFWYADQPPLAELSQFDWAVVEPGHLSTQDVSTLRSLGTKPFAYLSIGEFNGDQQALDAQAVNHASSPMRNKAWNSQVMDLTTAAWRDHLFKRAARLQSQGYAGLFLDTLDSFQLLPEADRPGQRQALVSFLRELHARQPDLQLFFNRGFEVLGELDGVAAAVAVESIHAGWDAEKKRFRRVPDSDRQWLEAQLGPLRQRQIPLVAIDYLPIQHRAKARKLVRQLSAEGFVPVVTSPELNAIGLSGVEVQPRRIAFVHDPRDGALVQHPGHQVLREVLEYLGYRIDPLAVDDLPQHRFRGLYAGVVVWMTRGVPADSNAFNTWLNQRLDEKVPLAIMDSLPIEDPALLQRLGLSPAARRAMPVLTARWGGMALAPYVVKTDAERSQWILDPFVFLREALRLPAQPRPDTTTENGRRILTAVTGGQGEPSLTLSLRMSDYLTRLHGLQTSSLARAADGSWQLRGLDGLRTLRLDPQLGWPDLLRSEGVAGVRDLPKGRYVHLSSERPRLVLERQRDPRPALEEANLPLSSWRYLNDQQVSFAFAGEFDLQFSVRAAGSCRVEFDGQQFTGTSAQGLWHFQLPYKQVKDAKLLCNR
ncbi:MAG TPA: endo alpha-1,4 polygalactosaminidase [Pseudomonas sp.]|uniref:endo alpha-1,4 polygalactosaminidase n=1 Tax=Pseudomonas sp. TaxID=306 RepID=UPI002B4A895C|nr:endo alpha-1,4 polygalactosaminidase [Pseudomonas sp.]HKS13337.1 endo alpha-1,4 polygalactosaminidase [Pseudomonas sp.]